MVSRSRSQLLWSYSSTILNSALQLLAAVTITRFVAPTEYGLVAIAMLCCRLPNYLSQLGMGRAVVQKAGLSDGNVRAAFTMSMGLGLVGCLAVATASPLLARFFREPRLTSILLVLSLNFIFQGASLVSGGLLRRTLRMRQLAIADTSSYLISTFAIALPIAVKGYGAWAIVAGTVSQTFITALLYLAATCHSLRPTFARVDFEHILTFGGKATGTSIIEGLGSSMDTLMLGRFSTSANVGFFSRTSLLIQLPVQNLSNGLTQVLFSRFSRASAQASPWAGELFQKSQRIFLAIVFPLCAGASVAASSIVLVVYGSKWSSAISVFAVLSILTAATASHHLPAIQLEALGRFRHKTIIQSLYLLCVAGGIYLSVPYGLVKVGITLTGLELCRSFALNYYSARYLNWSFRAVMSAWAPGLVGATAVAATIGILVRSLPIHGRMGMMTELIANILVSLVVIVVVYAIFFRRSVFAPLLSLIGARKERPQGVFV
jgi:O-antigen/teichoic acid export membrane protein